VPSQQPFKDLKVTMSPHPITGDLLVTKNDAAVKQAVVNLVLTAPGERFFDDQLGTRVSELLFEPLDFGTAGLIKDQINTTLRAYEPRIDITEITVDPNFEENAFDVALEFTIRGRQDEPPQNVNFLLQRTR
tara:strand:- start:3709 stop:4104 length:396 start_codon:yes stop_codon:yes gene_type:complete